MSEPLEKRTIRVQYNGVWKDVPALHRTWVTERAFPPYLPPPSPPLPLGARETWLELMEHLQEDLRWLLTLPHHTFWSQMIYTKAPLTTLTSFLQEAPPSYCCRTLPDAAMDSALRQVSRLVFLIYCRLSISRETPDHFFSPSAFGQVIYDNYIFTVPSMLDLCAVYGVSNRERVSKILRNVTVAQPKYLHDLTLARDHLTKVLDRAKDMLATGGWSEVAKDVRDVSLHVYDALSTLRIFLELCPKSCEVFGSTEFFSSIATFYSAVIPNLVKCDEHASTVQSLRGECVKIVRRIFEELMERTLEEKSPQLVELHLALVSEILSEGVFVLDYHAVHPLDVDLDVVANIFPDLDHVKIDYLLEALSSHLDLAPLPKKSAVANGGGAFVNYPHTSAAAASPSCGAGVSGVELESLITQVQDILPHLGSGFVEACLRHYEFSTERVVAAVLESSLPPSLEELQWDKAKPPVAVAVQSVAEEGAFGAGYRGKKPRSHRSMTQLLDDKRDVNAMRERFDTLRFVEDTTYDDEYDDTYESEEVAVREADDPDRLRRPFVTPRVLQQGRRQRIEEDEENEEEEEEEAPKRDQFVANPEEAPKRDQFVANPEEARARAEQRRATQQRNRDVVGKPKGHGQEKSVLINRANKQVHKAASGNHNRRDRAQRKRNQGMIPI